MSKQFRLNFILNSFGNLLVSGSTANGFLKVHTLNEATIKRIRIGVIGKICIKADDDSNLTTLDKTFYCSEEHIFSSSDFIMTEDYDEQLLEYAIPLAGNLPPSVVLEKGSVMYELYATMEEVFPDESTQSVNTQALVSVATLVDCNTIPKAAKEKSAHSAQANSCLCFKSQEINNSLLVTPRVHVPGDCIKINAVVFNTDTQVIRLVRAVLIQKVKLKFEDRSVKVHRMVSETMRGSILPEQVQVWRDELLRIPPLACTTYHKYLHISYKLKLTAVKGTNDVNSSQPLLEVPVIIGNLPLESTLSRFNPLPRCESYSNTLLPIPKQYQEYARSEYCIQPVEGSKFVPAYITYSTDYAMEEVELQ